MKINTTLQNQLADSLAGSFSGGVLEIRTGAGPTSANDAATGTLLCTIILPTPAFGVAAAGVASKAGTWQGIAVANGTAGYARFRNSGDSKRMDVTVGQGSGELSLDDTAILTNGTVTITGYTTTQPAS